jgi:hypothetical protein
LLLPHVIPLVVHIHVTACEVCSMS